jgi:hypothetical protein
VISERASDRRMRAAAGQKKKPAERRAFLIRDVALART